MCILLFHFCGVCHKYGGIHPHECNSMGIDCVIGITEGLNDPHGNPGMYCRSIVLCTQCSTSLSDESRRDILKVVEPGVPGDVFVPLQERTDIPNECVQELLARFGSH